MNDPESSEAGDAATALAKLSFNVDSLEKQIKDQVRRDTFIILASCVSDFEHIYFLGHQQ